MFPGHTVVSLYDWSTCHDMMPADAVHAKHFLKEPGFQKYGKDTKDGKHKKGDVKNFPCKAELDIDPYSYPDRAAGWIDDGKQRFRFRSGERPIHGAKHGVYYTDMPKGLTQLLAELGLYQSRLRRSVDGDDKSNCMTTIFMGLPHIDGQKSILAVETEGRGNVCLMLPKFHCELNPMERRWGRAKWYIRRHADRSLPTLRKNVLTALGRSIIPVRMSVKFECTCMKYMDAYNHSEHQDSFAAAAYVRAQREYKSHRGIPPSEYKDERKHRPWELKHKQADAAAALLSLFS